MAPLCHAVWAASLLLLGTPRFAAATESLKAGDAVHLRAQQTGLTLTMEEYNGERRHRYVHAQHWHHGLWQQFTVLRMGGNEGDAVLSGDSVLLRGHSAKCIDPSNASSMALGDCGASQAFKITKVGGALSDPIRTGDAVFLEAVSTGLFLGVSGMEVLASSATAGPEQTFIVEAHICGKFDGRWMEEGSSGLDIFVIVGDSLHFVDDIEFGLFTQGDSKFTTGLQGWKQHDAGELKDSKIHWTNGDVWIPTEGPFDGWWTGKENPGEKVFKILGDTLTVLCGATSRIARVSGTKFTTTEPEAPDSTAELVGSVLQWGNGDVWVLLAAGRFDGRWTSTRDHGQDFFDIEGDMLFFDQGLESKIFIDGNNFTTMLKRDNQHVKATLDASKSPEELQWSNNDVWVRFHDDRRDFWLPPTTATCTTSTMTTSATSTMASSSITAMFTTTTTTTTEPLCFEYEVTYEPMDMHGKPPSVEENVMQCRARCQSVERCTHFSYSNLTTPGVCHLQDFFSAKQYTRLGFVAGPPRCYMDPSKHGLVRLGQKYTGDYTYVPRAYRCVHMSRMYTPIIYSEFLTREKYKKGKQAVKGCRDLCKNHSRCMYYAIEFPARLCSLSPENAKESEIPYFNHVAAPVSCDMEDSVEQLFLASDAEEEAPEASRTTAGMWPCGPLEAALLLFGLGVVMLAAAQRSRCWSQADSHCYCSAAAQDVREIHQACGTYAEA
mmetsp:Transcript_34995/g.96765  ORF Transcript_34995/g.96765 Transcript_34995/m.96765 type:complete len:721 (-) Transcript_34995:313-2475(-)